MKLSIIIPTYNSAETLNRCLDSIISQSFTDWEVLIMDGSSKDHTIAVVQSYQDERIKIFSESDKGIYDAMNKGILKSQGEWLYFLGSDDWLYDGNVLQNIFSSNIEQYDIVYGEVDAEQLDVRYRGEWIVDKIDFNRCHQAIFYKSNIFSRLGYYDLRYNVLADYEFNLRWFFEKSILSRYIPQMVAHYSDGGYSVKVKDEAFYRDMGLIMLRYGRKQLSISQKKEYARRYISANPEKFLQDGLLRVYILFLRVFYYFMTK